MVTLTDQAIPPALADAYARLVTAAAVGPGGITRTRTRRAARQSPKRRKPNSIRAVYRALAIFMANNYAAAHDQPYSKAFERARYRDIITGIFPAAFWLTLRNPALSTYACTPTSTELTAPGPYAYRDAGNRPTTTAYSVGTLTDGIPSIQGATAAGLFCVTAYKFRRNRYPLPASPAAPAPPVGLLVAIINYTIDTSNRASRPMRTLRVRARLTTSTGGGTADLTPPTALAQSIFWRFRAPVTTYPYHHEVTAHRVTAVLRLRRDTGAPSPPSRLLLDYALDAKLGEHYNNNTSALITAQLNPAAVVIIPKTYPTTLPEVWITQTTGHRKYIPTGIVVAGPAIPAPNGTAFNGATFLTRNDAGTWDLLDLDGQLITAIPINLPGNMSQGNPRAAAGGWLFAHGLQIMQWPYDVILSTFTLYDDGSVSPLLQIYTGPAVSQPTTGWMNALPGDRAIADTADVLRVYSRLSGAPIATYTYPAGKRTMTVARDGIYLTIAPGHLYRLPFDGPNWIGPLVTDVADWSLIPIETGVLYFSTGNRYTLRRWDGSTKTYPTPTAWQGGLFTTSLALGSPIFGAIATRYLPDQ